MMKTIYSIFLIIVCASLAGAQNGMNGDQLVVRETPDGNNLAVVKIISGQFDANRNFERTLAGSGVIIDPRGVVITSRAVVFPNGSDKEYPEIWAGVMEAGRSSLRPNQAYRLKLIAHDPQLEIALLKIETRNANRTFSTVRFGETGNLRYGQELNLVGFMQANGTSPSAAEVSFLDYDDEHDLLKIEGVFLKGIDGGAIVDRKGNLIGIPTRAVSSQFVPFFNQNNEQIGQIAVEEVGLVVPVEAIQGFLRSVPNLVSFTIPSDLRKQITIEGAVNDKSTNEPIRRATIGILMPNNNSRQYIEAHELIAYARTDTRGAFKLNQRIKPGTYSVKVVHPDYKTEYTTIRIPTDSGRLMIEMTKEK
jgi:S1-C subfamily serine protease